MMIGRETRSNGTPADSSALSSLKRIIRISVNEAAATAIIPER